MTPYEQEVGDAVASVVCPKPGCGAWVSEDCRGPLNGCHRVRLEKFREWECHNSAKQGRAR